MFVNFGHILTKGLKSGLNYEPKSFQTLLNKLVDLNLNVCKHWSLFCKHWMFYCRKFEIRTELCTLTTSQLQLYYN